MPSGAKVCSFVRTRCRLAYPRGTKSVGDYGLHNFTPKTLKQCKQLCAKNPTCKSFEVDQRSGGKCHLKNQLPTRGCVASSAWHFINYNKACGGRGGSASSTTYSSGRRYSAY